MILLFISLCFVYEIIWDRRVTHIATAVVSFPFAVMICLSFEFFLFIFVVCHRLFISVLFWCPICFQRSQNIAQKRRTFSEATRWLAKTNEKKTKDFNCRRTFSEENRRFSSCCCSVHAKCHRDGDSCDGVECVCVCMRVCKTQQHVSVLRMWNENKNKLVFLSH